MKLAEISEQYKKCPELDRDDVLKLQDWVNKQPHLANIGELESILFLYSCHHSVEVAKQCVDTYQTVRTHCPEFFANRQVNLPEVKRSMDILLQTPLPGLTPDGYKVFYCSVMDSDPSKFIYDDAIKVFNITVDFCLMEEGIAKGHVIVLDMKGSVLGHVARLGLISMKKNLFYLQEALPFRLMGLHFINITPFMDKIVAMMKPFLKKELIDVMHLHSTMDTFTKFVPIEMLPNDYGGKADSRDEIHGKWYDHIRNNQEFLTKEEQECRVNEKLRPGKPKNAGDLFGVEGNFKKLDID